MKKINVAWIVLIGFCSVIVIGAVVYLFYRLYITHVYKRKRPWCEITSSLQNQSEKIIRNEAISLLPRQSVSPLIQEFLPYDVEKRLRKRKMITGLQFTEPPLWNKDLEAEWQEMETKNSFSTQAMSTQTSCYTMAGQHVCESWKADEESLEKYFSMTSSDELLTPASSVERLSTESHSPKQSPLRALFNPLINLSRRLLNKEEPVVEIETSLNYTIVEMEPIDAANISKDVSQPYGSIATTCKNHSKLLSDLYSLVLTAHSTVLFLKDTAR